MYTMIINNTFKGRHNELRNDETEERPMGSTNRRHLGSLYADKNGSGRTETGDSGEPMRNERDGHPEYRWRSWL